MRENMTQDNMLDQPEHDAINPSHYRSHPSGIECIEISKHLSGCLAQAFQYVWRCGQKDDPIQDMDKAIWFINAELSLNTKDTPEKKRLHNKNIGAKLSKVRCYEDLAGNQLKKRILTNIADATLLVGKEERLNRAIAIIEELKAEYAKT